MSDLMNVEELNSESYPIFVILQIFDSIPTFKSLHDLRYSQPQKSSRSRSS